MPAREWFGLLDDTIRVLVLDDDRDLLEIYRGWFGPYRFYHVDCALTIDEAWRFVTGNGSYHVLLYDLTVPQPEKQDFALIRRCALRTACIIVTAMEDSELSFRARCAGAVEFVKKGLLDEKKLLPIVNRWFLRTLLGALPCPSPNLTLQRITEALVSCRAATVTDLARLAQVQRSHLKQICSLYYQTQARHVLLAVRALCAAFASSGFCPEQSGTAIRYSVDDTHLSTAIYKTQNDIKRFLNRH